MAMVVEQRNQDATCYVGNIDEKVTETVLWHVCIAPKRRKGPNVAQPSSIVRRLPKAALTCPPRTRVRSAGSFFCRRARC